MQDFRTWIMQKAFETVPGVGYNRLLEELHDDLTLFYEILLTPQDTWETLRGKTYPVFVQHLKYKRKHPEQPQGVIVSIFWDDQCYLLDGQEFLNIFRELEGLSAEALHEQIQQWVTAGSDSGGTSPCRCLTS